MNRKTCKKIIGTVGIFFFLAWISIGFQPINQFNLNGLNLRLNEKEIINSENPLPKYAAGLGTIFNYSTFLGTAGIDIINNVAIDSEGYIYICGQTDSSAFPFTIGSYDTSHNGGKDGFIAKFNASGELEFATFLGGSGEDYCIAIAVDPAGDIHVAGNTQSSNFPTSIGANDTSLGGSQDAFITKLSSDGATLLYSSYIGGGNFEYVYDLKVNPLGQAYVVGYTTSTDFPVTPGALDASLTGTGSDGFLVRVSADATKLLNSTYLGGDLGDDHISAIVLDDSGTIYVAGLTQGGFPTTVGVYQDTFSGGNDGFICKINPSMTQLLNSTLIGGTKGEFITSLAIDAAQRVIIGGYTFSDDFNITLNAFKSVMITDDQDGFISVFDSNLANLVYSSYLGGSSPDSIKAIGVDDAQNIYVVGDTESTNFPLTAKAVDTTLGGSKDGFYCKFNAMTFAFEFSTYIGGSEDEIVMGMTMRPNSDNAFIVGSTKSANFPVVLGAYDLTFNDGSTIDGDGFLSITYSLKDNDGDGLLYFEEQWLGTSDFNVDSDNDGLNDNVELILGTNPTLYDTDGDGLSDGVEVLLGTNPLKKDTDNDGLNDAKEVELGTDPLNPDTDGDGLFDGREIELGTNPKAKDTDGDGLEDGEELVLGTDPTNPDTDGDGWNDGTDPFPLNPYLPLWGYVGLGIAAGLGVAIGLMKIKAIKKEKAKTQYELSGLIEGIMASQDLKDITQKYQNVKSIWKKYPSIVPIDQIRQDRHKIEDHVTMLKYKFKGS